MKRILLACVALVCVLCSCIRIEISDPFEKNSIEGTWAVNKKDVTRKGTFLDTPLDASESFEVHNEFITFEKKTGMWVSSDSNWEFTYKYTRSSDKLKMKGDDGREVTAIVDDLSDRKLVFHYTDTGYIFGSEIQQTVKLYCKKSKD